jgi:integrase
MAKPRRTSAGRWEIGLRHPSLPSGRKYFTFDTEEEAAAYAEQWRLMKQAGVEPPQEMLRPATTTAHTLGFIVRAWASSGLAAPSQKSSLDSLFAEVGQVRLAEADYTWLTGYVETLKVKKNLSPNSIRHRVQGLGRAIDEYLRHNPKVKATNPVHLLPKGYSSYSEKDAKLAKAAGGEAKADVQRDRRLHPGEEDRIVWALSGHQREDRERALLLLGGNALLTLFLVVVYSGLRLREAYMLRRGWIDMDAKVMRVQSTKQWRGKVAFRNVPIRPELHAALKTYLSSRALLPAAYLFPFMEEEDGLTLKQVTQRLSGRFRIAFDYAGITDLREHDLRHEATCRWLELRDASGNWMFRLEEINRIMGWAPNSTMAHRYASFRGEDLAQRLWGEPTPPAARKATRAARRDEAA